MIDRRFTYLVGFVKLSEAVNVKDLYRDENREVRVMRFYESENQMNLIEVGAGEVDGLCRVDEIDVFLQSYLLLCSYSSHSSSSIFLFSLGLGHVCCW